jgi:putative membrane protein
MDKESKSIPWTLILFWLLVFFFVLIWSAIHPHDYFTWFLEVLPALSGLAILAVTFRNFRFTRMAYWLMLIHSIILMIGGHYTYAEVPLFNWISDMFSMSRNNYDKIGHFAQGFAPAIITREILIRKSPVKKGNWLFFMVVCICLALSAFYEFIEWWVAVLTGTAAESFLGTQGYVWDTQSDMFMALVGAIVALSILSKPHDRALSQHLITHS